MPRSLASGKRKVVILSTKPADMKKPTIAELAAGIDASCRILSDGFKFAPTDSETVSEGSLCDRVIEDVPTRAKAQGGLTVFRYFDENGKPETAVVDTEDGIGDGVFQALRKRGTVVYVVTRFTSKYATEPFTAGDPVSVYKATTDVARDADAEGWQKSEIPMSVGDFEPDAEVAA